MPDPLVSLIIAAAVSLIAAVSLWPERGLLDRLRAWRRRSDRVLREDALKHLHVCWVEDRPASIEGLAGTIGIPVDQAVQVVEDLDARGLIHQPGQAIELTPEGRRSARHIIRAHRLLERYLAESTGYQSTEWHPQAERLEHSLSAKEADELSAELGHPAVDPHGDPIPTAAGELVGHTGTPLPQARLDIPLRIVHLEDEPQSIYAQLVAEDLHVGQDVRLISKDARRIRFWAMNEEHVLAPILAQNVAVKEVSHLAPTPDPQRVRLSDLKPGEEGVIAGISTACRGPERRRLLDLGVLPGTETGVDLISPGGNPKAYRIRGALIALRDDQASRIWVRARRSMAE